MLQSIPLASSACWLPFLLLVSLLICGAILQEIEAPSEIQRNEELTQFFRLIRGNLSDTAFEKLQKVTGIDAMKGTQGFVSFNEATGTWQKDATSFFSSVAYSFHLCSTIGYGSYSAHTAAGKVMSMAVVFLLFPLLVISYTCVGELWLYLVASLLFGEDELIKQVFREHESQELSARELTKVLDKIGLSHLQPHEVDDLLRQHDVNRNGRLDRKEFTKMIQRLKLKHTLGMLGSQAYKVVFASVCLLVAVVAHTLFSFFVMSLTMLDAFYYTMMTVTTVGLGDVVPSKEWRFPDAVFAFIGIVFNFMLLQALLESYIRREEGERRRRTSESMEEEPSNEVKVLDPIECG